MINKLSQEIHQNNNEKTKKHAEMLLSMSTDFLMGGINEETFISNLKHTSEVLSYGTDDYKESLSRLKVALSHHYENNSHHPEHYENGVDGMNLFDLIEMFFDWKAAGERHADGNIHKSIEVNKDRFNISEQLASILNNTANYLGYKNESTCK